MIFEYCYIYIYIGNRLKIDQSSLLNAMAMNARIIGSGKEAILLPYGYGSDQSFWDKVTPCLFRTYQVLVFDWNFSGAANAINNLYDPVKYSSYDAFADDLIALLDEFSLRGSVLWVSQCLV